ncbi:MAG: lipoate--protein ligase family protein [Lentisphaeria bacterium]
MESDKQHNPQIRSLQGEIWLFWHDTEHEPWLNMALDETLIIFAAQQEKPIVRFYSWDRPAVSIGYIQKYSAGKRADWPIVRRPTGGGIVLHDHDFTYTVAIPAGHYLNQTDRIISYGAVNNAVATGLSKLNMPAELSDAHIPSSVARDSMVCFSHPTKYDILLNNTKIAGSAQRRTRRGILHQGSIHFNGPLPCPREKLAEKLTDGFAEYLGVEAHLYNPPSEIFSEAHELVKTKYGLDDWNKKRL